MSSTDRFAPQGTASRNAAVTTSVVALHVAALWAVSSGLLKSQAQPPEPHTVTAVLIAPEPPKMAPEPPPPAPPKPPPAPPKPAPAPRPAPAPKPLATKAPPAPSAPVAEAEAPAPAAPTLPTPPSSPPASPAPPAPPAQPVVQMPSSDAAYLNNPRPEYPALSKRMNEEGKVVIRAYVDEKGEPHQVDIKQSSGYERLDSAALDAVRRWRFKPGTFNGEPKPMWVITTLNFNLKR